MATKKVKKRKIRLSTAKKRAWVAFSRYIRTKNSVGGMVNCVTCHRLKSIKQIQAGHFIPGRHNSVLFDERNVHPQCYVCNLVLGGNGPAYYQFMQKTYGIAVIRELQKLDKRQKKYTVEEFLDLEKKYISLTV